MKVGHVEIGPHDYIEVTGRDEILVVHSGGEAEMLVCQSDVIGRLIKKWQEEYVITEYFENGAGI